MDTIYTALTQGKTIAERTPQEWVNYCLQKEHEVLEARETTLHDGRSIKMESLATIQKARIYWENRVKQAQQPKNQPRFGGFRVKTADMS